MSNKDIAKNLIDQIPDSKMYYIIAYLQGAAVPEYPEEVPNPETMQALEEVEQMKKDGSGEHFTGLTADFLANLLED